MPSVVDNNFTPGITRGTETVDNEYIKQGREWAIYATVTISSAARDDTHTSYTTTLRKGLVLGRITASGKYAEYDDTASDGTQVARAILDEQVKVVDVDAVARDVSARVCFDSAILVDPAKLYELDDLGRADFENIKFTDDI